MHCAYVYGGHKLRGVARIIKQWHRIWRNIKPQYKRREARERHVNNVGEAVK